jgi:hypothetical protein
MTGEEDAVAELLLQGLPEAVAQSAYLPTGRIHQKADPLHAAPLDAGPSHQSEHRPVCCSIGLPFELEAAV